MLRYAEFVDLDLISLSPDIETEIDHVVDADGARKWPITSCIH